MSTFDDSSLVFIPSGYKTSKAYSVKPTDGSGDLTFSRSNDTATRVASNGLIERVRTNVVLRSEEQSNAQYAVIINEIASRVAVANPLTGQNNAYKITSTANNDPYIGQVVTGLSNGENTFSLWLWTDAGQSTEATLFFYNQTASEEYTKAITLTTTPTRFDHTVNFSNIGSNATVRVDLRQTGPSIQYIYTYGWQAESGVATAYIATTSAAVSVGPVANVPRLDYLNSSCPRLLLEPQRTNLLTYSEQLNNAAWNNTLYPVTITANQTASPSGYVDADLLTPTAALSRHAVGESASGTAGSVYTASAFFKKGGSRYVVLTDGGDAVWHIVTADLDTATITNQTNATGTITNYGSGWYRVTCTFTRTNTSTIDIWAGASNTASAVALPSFNDVTLTTFAWGISLELGAYATSYISTQNSAVTRGADACSKTGISSLIGQTEGTIFFEVDKTTRLDNDYRVQISDGTTNNWLFVSLEVGNAVRLYCNVGGVHQFSVYGSVVTSGRHKVAMAYKANDFKVYVDGVAWITQTSGSVPACSKFNLGSPAPTVDAANTDSKTIQALLFKTRLTNAQLAELTTL